MANLNIFRIDPQKECGLIKCLSEKNFDRVGSKKENGCEFAFYLSNPHHSRDVSWGWICSAFNYDVEEVFESPKAVLTVRKIAIPNETVQHPMFAITFGAAFLYVDKYCDKSFGFDCMKRLEFERLNLTAVNKMGSVRNKVIASYKKVSELNPAGGESYSKIKAKLSLPGSLDYIGGTAEAGSALKLTMKEASLSRLSLLIEYIEKLLTGKEIHRIPHFEPINDKVLIDELEEGMRKSFEQKLPTVVLSEFAVVGSEEVFNRADLYQLYASLKGKEDYAELSIDTIMEFCAKHEIQDVAEMMRVRVRFIEDGKPRKTVCVHDLIDYMDEDRQCLLCDGVWRRFNYDYMSYLHESLSEIPVVYNQDFDLKEVDVQSYHEAMLAEAERKGEFDGLDEKGRKEKISRKYYPEYVFNRLRVEKNGYALYDRVLHHVVNSKFELCDLMKDGAIFFVKRGNASGGLTYMVDQSMVTVDLLRKHALPDAPEIKKVGLWIILQRRRADLPMEGKTLEWMKLNMLLFKVQIEEWKRRVRDAGMEPIIYLNYEEP